MIYLFFLGLALLWSPVLVTFVKSDIELRTAQRIGQWAMVPGLLALGSAVYFGLHPTQVVDYLAFVGILCLFNPQTTSVLWIGLIVVCGYLGSHG